MTDAATINSQLPSRLTRLLRWGAILWPLNLFAWMVVVIHYASSPLTLLEWLSPFLLTAGTSSACLIGNVVLDRRFDSAPTIRSAHIKRTLMAAGGMTFAFLGPLAIAMWYWLTLLIAVDY